MKPDDDFEVTLLSYYRPNAETTPYASPRPLADVEQRWFCGALATSAVKPIATRWHSCLCDGF
jgi:hypothetical protein